MLVAEDRIASVAASNGREAVDATQTGTFDYHHLREVFKVEQSLINRPEPSIGRIIPVSREIPGCHSEPALQNTDRQFCLCMAARGD